jgi:hypothetical protein
VRYRHGEYRQEMMHSLRLIQHRDMPGAADYFARSALIPLSDRGKLCFASQIFLR